MRAVNLVVLGLTHIAVKPNVLGFTDIKKPIVLYHPVQAKNLNFNPYIYILNYQSNMPYNLTPSPAYTLLK